MSRSFRQPEKAMPVKQRQPQINGSFRNSALRDKEEELGLFLEMKKREKECHDLFLHNVETDFISSSPGSRTGNVSIFSMPSATTVRKTGADEFLNSENDKNDYEWLLTPPGTPLFPSLEMESSKTVANRNGTQKAQTGALRSRLSSTQPESTGRNGLASRPRAASPAPSTGPRRPSSSGAAGSGAGSRPSTPTGRPVLGTQARTISNTVTKSNPTSTTTVRPRSSTPISRPIVSSSKPTPPASSVPIPALNRAYAKANDNVSPGMYGTKMVERVVNMRKLAPPKQDDKHSPHSNLSAKSSSSSPDTLGFGRSLSKKSLDMAMRHMDIRRTLPGNLRPLMTKIPASSMYSVRSGPPRNRMINASGSPVATSSNASSEMSVHNHPIDDIIDDECNSEKGVRSPAIAFKHCNCDIQNASRIEEKDKAEKQLLNQIIDEADEYKIGFHSKRKIVRDNSIATGKHTFILLIYLATHDKFHTEADKNYWNAIADFIPKAMGVIETRGA
ncbi:hypothetical protein M8C21_006472 [Ambrosia artemisiifolia]|uniref:Uncharacterized protein n=1 Tax=Ambrosia artemisiifolia TaxID=4212 RepID=A0AAD5GFZ0_AMBAR|nr:hypothetical protein M8C21_006472 [Ambrosia artemisiifolia]